MQQPAGTPGSEFALPVRAREIARRIVSEVIAPAEEGFSTAHRARESGKQACTARMQAESKRVEAVRQQQGRLADEATSAAERLLQSLRQSRSAANALLERFELEPRPAALPGEEDSPAPVDDLPIEQVEALAKRSANLAHHTKPGFFPRNIAARWAVGIGALFVAVNLPALLLLYPVGYFLVLWGWKGEICGTHSAMVAVANRLEAAVTEYGRRAKARRDAAVAKAEAEILAPARLAFDAEVRALSDAFADTVSSLHLDLAPRVAQLHEACQDLWNQSTFAALPWDAEQWLEWEPDESPAFAAQVGVMHFTADPKVAAALPGLALHFQLPGLVPFAEGRCLLLDAAPEQKQQAADALHSVVIRALATTPPGKARFVFLDPLGLGQNVADFMSLADHDAALIAGKAWSEPRHIEEQLAELTEHMETVIQKYLRREFQSILDYNAFAQEVAEPFRFLVVFDFPVNFTAESARRLASIVRNGARCGVFAFVHRDRSKPLPYGVSAEDIELAATKITWTGARTARWEDEDFGSGLLVPDSVGDRNDLVRRMIGISGERAAAAMKVEVPFDRLAPPGGVAWAETTSAPLLRVPLGPSGARKFQELTFGTGLAHHALIVGRTGSGKTNLMHVIITGLALKYGPSEIELFLVDFKGGVSFKPYALHGLPHARVIAIESDREFGMSVLQGLDATLKARFETFRAAGVDNIVDFRAKRPADRVPRIVLVVDEYQEFFSEDDVLAAQARGILERIARQGRSFGIHILLASQSLTGTSQLPQSILGQLAVRIALPCNQADARQIFAEDNGAARVLSRPGEAIYNDGGGIVEANSPFQAARFTDGDLIQQLGIISDHASRLPPVPPAYVFEGNEPAQLGQSPALAGLISRANWQVPRSPRAWLGEPVAMLPSVDATFHARPGRNLLIITRDEAEGVGVLQASWVSLLCQHRPTTARFYVLDLATADEPWAEAAERFRETFDHQIECLTRRNLPAVLAALQQEIADRGAGPVQHRVYLLIIGLHRARDLRPDEEQRYKPDPASNAARFAAILRDGPEAGVHTIAWCDSVPNARRTLDRSLGEFGLRVAGSMSLDESNVLLDAPAAARLTRAHRMLLADEERPGVLQKFRPYAVVPDGWLRELAHAQRAWAPEEGVGV